MTPAAPGIVSSIGFTWRRTYSLTSTSGRWSELKGM